LSSQKGICFVLAVVCFRRCLFLSPVSFLFLPVKVRNRPQLPTNPSVIGRKKGNGGREKRSRRRGKKQPKWRDSKPG
jgi:hypothetical protein